MPPNPSLDGWHWLETKDGGCRMSIYWNAATQRWDDSPANQITPEEMGEMGWHWDGIRKNSQPDQRGVR
jgi:hypothetical protein